MMKQITPIHEKLLFSSFLAAAAGGFDAYTYLVHGEVFAGLQTGNLILLGTHIGQLSFSTALHYLVPLLSFMLGTILAHYLQNRLPESDTLVRRKQLIITFEIILLLLVAFISPVIPDMLASALVSIAAAAQLQEFRRLNNGPFASLMMTGNIRTLAESLFEGIVRHDTVARTKAVEIGTIISSFTVGAAVTGAVVPYLAEKTIVLSSIILLMPLFLLTYSTKNK
ncbi:YoaK family protein [Dellaglioa algida]|uniref:YoaK family protein n=1 Tax=Dellaglioa algida TaxID=105612 RepID=UPI000BD584C8|nr:YoaK family protein [Dellaglioa algida]MDK1717848.1 DUF1275 domain-containing protein [Dellaglioa algida]MDK1727851.1 DUF1275 domain-containing protein [Dellaglioa algida]MDK1729247.1 DUF1275 domain-containing protein [Dellaglioa algida]MDK1736447.1 DUF1275 domain-containing protein [Dellaglioa algida]MDK1737181.1 DUF1275 domain-containing protein [Dellaglioa algida]